MVPWLDVESLARKRAWQEIPRPGFHLVSLVIAVITGRLLSVGFRNYLALVIPVLVAAMLFIDYFGRLASDLSQRPVTSWDCVVTALLDWLIEAAILGGLAMNILVDTTTTLTALLMVSLTVYTGVLTKAAGADQRRVGLLQKRDRLILIAVMSLLIPWVPLTRVAFILSSVLIAGCVVTIGQRLFYAREKLLLEQKRARRKDAP